MTVVIELLTARERDYTMTNYQISMSLKSIVAQLVNCVFIPIIANYFIKDNIYEENGLISDVLILGITTSLMYPLAKMVNPSYILFYLIGKWRLLPSNKLSLHQYQVNQTYEKLQFEIGY